MTRAATGPGPTRSRRRSTTRTARGFTPTCTGAKAISAMPPTGIGGPGVPPRLARSTPSGTRSPTRCCNVDDICRGARRALHPYLNYGGNCEEAFTFCERNLGGKITMLMRHGDAPEAGEETFFASRFAMLRDRFGTSWMLLHPKPGPT